MAAPLPTQVMSTYMHGKEHNAPGALPGAYDAFRTARNTALEANRAILAPLKRLGYSAQSLKGRIRTNSVQRIPVSTPRNLIGYNALNRLINELPGPTTRRRKNARKSRRTRRNRRN